MNLVVRQKAAFNRWKRVHFIRLDFGYPWLPLPYQNFCRTFRSILRAYIFVTQLFAKLSGCSLVNVIWYIHIFFVFFPLANGCWWMHLWKMNNIAQKNPLCVKDENLWNSHWCLIRTHHNYPLNKTSLFYTAINNLAYRPV